MKDMKQLLDQTNQATRRLGTDYPDLLKGLGAFGRACEGGQAVPKKYKELIAVALSVVQQCSYCIAFHVKAALGAGASRDEIMEATFVAVLMGGGPAFMYAKEAYQALDDFGA
mgnify:CR=1 FL=1